MIWLDRPEPGKRVVPRWAMPFTLIAVALASIVAWRMGTVDVSVQPETARQMLADGYPTYGEAYEDDYYEDYIDSLVDMPDTTYDDEFWDLWADYLYDDPALYDELVMGEEIP